MSKDLETHKVVKMRLNKDIISYIDYYIGLIINAHLHDLTKPLWDNDIWLKLSLISCIYCDTILDQ